MATLPPILAVDDTPDDLFFLKRLLTKAGVKNLLITLEDAVQAKAFLSGLIGHPKSPILPCVVFTDLNMPLVSGLDLVKWIRTDPSLKNVPVVMLSSSNEEHDVAKARAAGVDEYFQKFPVPEIFAKLIANLSCR